MADSPVDQQNVPYAGDAPCHGAPIDGPVQDLNVMVRRGEWHARVARITSSGALDADAMTSTVLIVSTHASATVAVGSAQHTIGAFDALRIDDADCRAPLPVAATLDGVGGALYVVSLTRIAQD